MQPTTLEAFSLLVVILADLRLCQELSLRIVIQNRPELSKLASDRILQNTEVLTYLGNAQLNNTAFFAPSNDAFNSLPGQLQLQLNSATKDVVNNIFKYHLVPGVGRSSPFNPFSVLEGQQVRALSQFSNTPLYISRIEGVVYVNGGQITTANLTALNGVIHVVSEVFVAAGLLPLGLLPLGLLPLGRPVSGYDFVTDQNWSMSSMFRNFADYQLKGAVQSGPYGQLAQTVLSNPAAFCTIFLPSNDFLSLFKIVNQDLYARISGQTPSLLKQVVESLVIPSGAYHSSVLERLTASGKVVGAVTGEIRVYRMDGALYASNRCGQAKVVAGDITTTNCVVHIVDNFLGLVTTDVYNETLRQTDLQEFSRSFLLSSSSSLVSNLKAKGGPEYLVPESEKFTLFAPTNDVFRYVDFSRNDAERLQQLSMLIAPASIDLSYMKDGDRVTSATMRPGYPVTISRVKQEYYVEVNHVKAKVTQGNICTTNGFIHKVDRVVGLPDGTIGDYLSRWLELRRLQVHIESTGLLTTCINKFVEITLFAPNESAVMNLDDRYLGQQNKNKLIRRMKSHLGTSALYLESIADGSSAKVETLNGVVQVSRTGEDFWANFGDQRIKIIRGNIGASNGVIHVIEDFLPDNMADTMSISSRSAFSIGCFAFVALCLSV